MERWYLDRAMIDWKKRDNYIYGRHELGQAWIRLDREGKCAALYIITTETEKFPVEDEDEQQPETLKLKAELLLDQLRVAKQMANLSN